MSDERTLSQLMPELRRPFTQAAVKMKPQVVTKDQKSGLVTYYIDARLAAERLNHVVGAEHWSDSYRLLAEGTATPALFFPVECSLTVFGVTKTDVGQSPNTVLDDKAWKTAYSDALKRAAVKFGVGVFLYNLPNVWAETKVGQNGKAQGFTDKGVAHARSSYVKWLASPANIYGEPLDHGDLTDHEVEGSAPGSAEAGGTENGEAPNGPVSVPPAAKPTKAELANLVEIVDGLIADGQMTSEQLQKAARSSVGWPELADTLPKAQVVDLTRRLTTFRENLVAS